METCRADAEAMAAVNGADLVLPDGIGVIYGAKLLGTPLKSRVPGIEFGTAMLAHCAETGKRVYLFGADVYKRQVMEKGTPFTTTERFKNIRIAVGRSMPSSS